MNGASRRLTPTSARQGRPTRHMIWMLVFSVVLATAALAAIWAWDSGGFTRAQHRVAVHPAAAASFHTAKPPI